MKKIFSRRMKPKYYLHGKLSDYKYPYLINVVNEVFETVESMKFSRYFDRPKVHVYPYVITPQAPRNFAFVEITPDDSPAFHFSINCFHSEYVLQPFIFSCITRSPIFNDYQAMRATVGHEIGHWVLLKSLAKLPCYGGSAQIVNLLNRYHYNNLDGHIDKSDMDSQLTYRSIYPERWADRVARIILSKMPEMGRSEEIVLRNVHEPSRWSKVY